ncbi:hypothetical protein D3C81_2106140 [compost metagenome]
MPSKLWPRVWSVLPLVSPLRVASSNQVKPTRLPMVRTQMYTLQKVLMTGSGKFIRLTFCS